MNEGHKYDHSGKKCQFPIVVRVSLSMNRIHGLPTAVTCWTKPLTVVRVEVRRMARARSCQYGLAAAVIHGYRETS